MEKKVNTSVNMMESGPVKKTLITLGIPSIVAMMIMAVYNFVDTYFIGMLNDTPSMGAVSITFPLVMIFSALGQMIGVGAASYVGRTLGNKQQDLADKTASISVLITIVISVITTVVGLLFLSPILKVLGASETVLPVAIQYTRWLFIGTIFTLMNSTLTALVRAEGNSKLSMIALILGAVVNIILDPIFMFVFKGGVSGAALATVIGQICTTVYLMMYYMRKKSVVHIKLKQALKKPFEDMNIYAEIFKIGIPVFLMQFLLSIASTLLNNAAMPYGDSAVAAMGVSNRIYMIPVYIIAGFNQGFQPFAAYNYGAKLYKRLNEGIRFTLALLGIFTLICTLVLVSFPEVFVKAFTQDPEVLSYGSNALSAFSLLFPIVALILIITSVFQGMGRAKESAIISIARQGIILIPMAIFLPKIFDAFGDNLGFIKNLFQTEMPNGLYGVMLAQPLSDMITAIVTVIIALRPLKELKRLEKEQEQIEGPIEKTRLKPTMES